MKTFKDSFINIFFIFLFFILLFVSYLSYQRIDGLVFASDLVNHSNVVKLKIEEALSSLKDAETGQRGYLLTKDSLYLQPYHGSLDRVKKIVHDIDLLTADDPEQHNNAKTLALLVEDKYKLLDLLINFSKDS